MAVASQTATATHRLRRKLGRFESAPTYSSNHVVLTLTTTKNMLILVSTAMLAERAAHGYLCGRPNCSRITSVATASAFARTSLLMARLKNKNWGHPATKTPAPTAAGMLPGNRCNATAKAAQTITPPSRTDSRRTAVIGRGSLPWQEYLTVRMLEHDASLPKRLIVHREVRRQRCVV